MLNVTIPNKYLEDSSGNKSSKRWWGNRLLTIGVALAILLYVANIIIPFLSSGKLISGNTNDICYDIISLFFFTGGGLIFGGVFETFRKKK